MTIPMGIFVMLVILSMVGLIGIAVAVYLFFEWLAHIGG